MTQRKYNPSSLNYRKLYLAACSEIVTLAKWPPSPKTAQRISHAAAAFSQYCIAGGLNLRYGSFIIKCRPPNWFYMIQDCRDWRVCPWCWIRRRTLVAYRAIMRGFFGKHRGVTAERVSQDCAVLTWCIEELVQRDRCAPRELVAYAVSEKPIMSLRPAKKVHGAFVCRTIEPWEEDGILYYRLRSRGLCAVANDIRKPIFTNEYVTTPAGYNFSLKTRQTCDILLRPTAAQIAELVGLTTAFPGKMLVRGVNSDDDVARRMEACKELLAVMRQEYGWKGFDRRGCFRQSVDNSANLSHWIKKPIT